MLDRRDLRERNNQFSLMGQEMTRPGLFSQGAHHPDRGPLSSSQLEPSGSSATRSPLHQCYLKHDNGSP